MLRMARSPPVRQHRLQVCLHPPAITLSANVRSESTRTHPAWSVAIETSQAHRSARNLSTSFFKIWSIADGKELRTIKAHLGTVTALAFSADGQWLASGGTDNLVKIWSVK